MRKVTSDGVVTTLAGNNPCGASPDLLAGSLCQVSLQGELETVAGMATACNMITQDHTRTSVTCAIRLAPDDGGTVYVLAGSVYKFGVDGTQSVVLGSAADSPADVRFAPPRGDWRALT